MKKVVVWLMSIMMVASLVGCGFSDEVKDGMNDAMSQETTQDETDAEEEATEAVEANTTAAETSTEDQEEPEQVAAEETKEQEEQEQPEQTQDEEPTGQEQTGSINVLLTAPVTVHDVKNGTKTEKIGEWAEVVVAKELLEATTDEEFAEFCNEVVKDSGYNWVTISCGDGTGIQFQGSISSVATYGKIDTDGCIEESIGTIMVQEDGTYSYTEN